MANFQLNWTPATPSNGQIPYRIIRFNDGFTSWIAGPNLIPSANTYTWIGLLNNIAYKFKVQNECLVGGPTDGNIYEWIEFACNSLVLDSVTTTTADLHYTREPNSGLEGGPSAPFISTDIDNVEYYLYDATNTILVSGPTLGAGAGYDSNINYSGLTPGTTYTVRYVLLATVNGVQVRSDAANQLGTYCSQQFTTLSAPCPPPTDVFGDCENCYAV